MKLKFELVNGYGILIDEEADIRKGDIFYLEDANVIAKYETVEPIKESVKIIFAEKELGLDVPVFEWRDFEVEKLAEKSSELQEGTYTIPHKTTYKHGFIDGYKFNPAKFTEDEVVEFVMSVISQYEFGNKNIHNRELITESLKSIQKYPKYVVMEMEAINDFGEPYSFDDMDFGVEKEYRPKLFTNSNGKKQGTVKELIW